ncbi:MAG TPA: hypothetical protein VIM12_14620 [Noviherbaspirillum sp.]|jgi:hypothetical protein|uniref:hypothetical protein n=1 Tax=Noviherbaspirillum sp. TaxID=1926288 RepID=UPI002F9459BB
MKMKKDANRAALVLGAALLLPMSVALAQLDSVKTAGGNVRVGEVDYTKTLMLGNKPIAGVEPNDHVSILRKFSVSGNDVLLVSTQCGGSACALVGYQFVTVGQGGKISVSAEMHGADGQDPQISVTGDTITLKLVAFVGRKQKTTTWVYQNGVVKKA